MKMKLYCQLLTLITLLFVSISRPALAQSWSEVITSDASKVTARHESNAVELGGYIYVFGGRGNRPVDRYDPINNVWKTVAQTPVEMHHFQAVVFNQKIYIVGAFTCCYPAEPTLQDIYVFDPTDNTWTTEGTMPSSRLRGSAGTFTYDNKIYVIGGNTAGHSGGAVPWFDEYDPVSGIWRTLPDAPNSRDHVTAAVVGTKLVVAAGRKTNIDFTNTVGQTDVFDFATNTWSRTAHDIPTERAGAMAVSHDNRVYIIGGESGTLASAHANVEVFNPDSGTWRALDNMVNPRHGGGAAMYGSILHVFAGSTTRGGGGETSEHEIIDLSEAETTELPPTPPTITFTDTDTDRISDFDETNTYGTNPNNSDSDSDGIDDFVEIFTTYTDPNNTDTDSDGLADGLEIDQLGTNPLLHDTDSDGLSDFDEYSIHGTNPISADSDDDGITDGVEVSEIGSNPLLLDSDSDGLSDYVESYTHNTNPSSPDTDGDFVSDGDEINTYLSNPLSTDTDGDGISDSQEIALGSNLSNIDEDGDGLINSVDGTEDTDRDGIPNFADLDSDNDSIPDTVELGYSDVNRDGMLDSAAEALEDGNTQTTPSANTRDTDGDGIPDYIDLDSDQDGIPDLAEARSNYTSNAQRLTRFQDEDRNGLTDEYNLPGNTIPANSDGDLLPDFVDLDSDNDGYTDTVESGSTDLDSNGEIDDFLDLNQDGISDANLPALGKSLPDDDRDSIPNLIDTEHNRSGCSIAIKGAPLDPTLLLLLALALLGLRKKRMTLRPL